MTELILSTLGVILFSGIFSGTETALFSTTLAKAEQLYKEKSCSLNFITVIRDRDGYVSTLVFLNNIVNIAGSIYVGGLASELLGGGIWEAIFSSVLTMLIIMFAEILPKSIGNKKSFFVISIMGKPLKIAKWILNPIVLVVTTFTNFLVRLMFGKIEEDVVSESEIRYLVATGAQCSKSEIRENEQKIIEKSFDLHDTEAKDIMTPRVCMSYVQADQTLAEIADSIIDSEHTRIIVTGESIDDVIGFALKSQILTLLYKGKGDMKVADIQLHNIREVSETISAEALMVLFKREQRHIAIVKDIHGGVSGLVTLEDSLEILIGEIVDETDKTEDMRELAADIKLSRKLKRNSSQN